jgi:serine/threonine-protein kinase
MHARNAVPGPADQLLQRWQQGERVDVDTFVRTVGRLSATDLADVLRLDQRRRWNAGERILAENYFERFPDVCTDADAAVDVLFQEFLLRQQTGERPDSKEYAERFPAYADMLESQIALQSALDGMDASLRATRATAQTVVFPADDGMPSSKAVQAPIGLLVRDGMSSQLEVRSLLRKRLRLIALFTSLVLLGSFPASWLLMTGPGAILLSGTLAIGSCASAIWLWSRQSISLRMLRWIEAGLFGAVIFYFGWQDIEFFQSGWFSTLVEYGRGGIVTAVRSQNGQWALLIILYGILIPNTARSCFVAVTLMVLIRLAILVGGVISVSAVTLADRAQFLFASVLGMGIVSAIAIFGAHRIESLRRTASEARKLGPYQLIRRLGSGGMGQVYLAQHALLRRPCALKLIRPDQVGDRDALARFEREVQTMATLTHPNTVRVYDYGLAADGTFYYAMEYLSGLSLEELVAEHGPLPPARVVHLLRQVCGALREAHTVGLVHRDIKPANILACQIGGMYDVAKLFDFGLVRVHALSADAGLTGLGAIAGTPAFMSPEQAAGSADVDARSDIYSLGAVAYFLLTGEAPFVRSTSVQTMAAHLAEPLVPPRLRCPEIPNDLEGVVLRCLAKEPNQRYADIAAVEEALACCACTDSWSGEQAAVWWRDKEHHSVAMALNG